jgi:Protein of unknown function (DUF2281)
MRSRSQNIANNVTSWEQVMNLAETIYQHSLNLPETAAREALDFIEFLEQRYASVPAYRKQPNDTEAFLTALAGGLSEDFPNDINNDDLGVDVQREALD